MAEDSKSIFNTKATEKLRNPDDLDKYVQVTNPGVWVVLLACIALLVGLLAWGVFGAVDTNVTCTGAAITKGGSDSPKVMCFLQADKITEVKAGDAANVGGEQMTVSDVQKVPLSKDELKELLGSDYLTSTLVQGDWAYAVTFEGDASELPVNVPVDVRIRVKSVAPISLILRDRG